MDHDFDLSDFLPYLLNQAAERVSVDFQREYKGRYGMLRTEWRVLFHLGRYGDMTATDIGRRASLHKTKISRAVTALGAKRFVDRTQDPDDRRQEVLRLTRSGRAAFRDLAAAAHGFDVQLTAQFSATEAKILRACLIRIAASHPDQVRGVSDG